MSKMSNILNFNYYQWNINRLDDLVAYIMKIFLIDSRSGKTKEYR